MLRRPSPGQRGVMVEEKEERAAVVEEKEERAAAAQGSRLGQRRGWAAW
jgi:hypothetical protein